MSKKSPQPAPKSLLKLKEKLEHFRKNRTGKKRLPDKLWIKAAGLASSTSVGLVSKHLRLNYYDLKKWIEKIHEKHKNIPDFIELNKGAMPSLSESCTFEFENILGEKLRINILDNNQGKFIKLIEDFLSRSR